VHMTCTEVREQNSEHMTHGRRQGCLGTQQKTSAHGIGINVDHLTVHLS
jgi:hypothetical protein